MDQFPGNWGNPRSRDETVFTSTDWFPGALPAQTNPSVHTLHANPAFGPKTMTQQPIVTGTSVIGLVYKDGVMLAADNLASYGSLARFRDVERLIPVGNNTVVGASGDISDFQYLKHTLDSVITKEYYTDDGHTLSPPQIYEYISRLMYARRSKFDPLWNSLVVGGFKDGKKFLGFVDLQGTTYQSSTIATGFGAYLAVPILRKSVEGREDLLTEEEASKILDECMRVLYYRDARSLNKFQKAKIDANGVTISEPMSLPTEWSFAEGIRGYGA
ncbi:Proteasome subunit beta type-7 [Nowakowskiella sp. JEL0407]|nr:Proteasome subunit beta type-7 [Nowakowskiella sp. JEL0407]